MTKKTLSAETLREYLDYNAETGVLTWKERPVCRPHDQMVNTKYAGKEAGNIGQNGYRYIRIREFGFFLASRLIWLYETGEWPPKGLEVDHVDLNPLNNRWSNLRLTTPSQNMANTRAHRDSRSGVKGVSWSKRDKKWVAQIMVGGKQRCLGRFGTIKEAKAVYDRAALSARGKFARAA